VQALLNDICFLLKRPEEHNHVKLRASYKWIHSRWVSRAYFVTWGGGKDKKQKL
jgi:hypothetical protein